MQLQLRLEPVCLSCACMCVCVCEREYLNMCQYFLSGWDSKLCGTKRGINGPRPADAGFVPVCVCVFESIQVHPSMSLFLFKCECVCVCVPIVEPVCDQIMLHIGPVVEASTNTHLKCMTRLIFVVCACVYVCASVNIFDCSSSCISGKTTAQNLFEGQQTRRRAVCGWTQTLRMHFFFVRLTACVV